MCAMLFIVLVLSAALANGADVAKCSNGTETIMTMIPSNDTIVGRYNVKVCTEADRNWTAWELDLTYYNTDKQCTNPHKGFIHTLGSKHSNYMEYITFEGTCSYVCLETTLDMVFSACYSLDVHFKIKNTMRSMSYKLFNIDNNHTYENFRDNRAVVYVTNYDKENLTFLFHTGAPFRSYHLDICRIINMTTGLEVDGNECRHMSESDCTSKSSLELSCDASLPPGCYRLGLKLFAPWDGGIIGIQGQQGYFSHTYCSNATSVTETVGGGGGVWWGGAGAALLVAAGGLLLLLWRARQAISFHKKVLLGWLEHTRVESSPVPAAAAAAAGPEPLHIVLLYAREGPPGDKLIAALTHMLEDIPGVKVWDIFSAETLAAAGAGAGAWLRARLRAAGARVLLLQTPALAALHAPTPAPAPGPAPGPGPPGPGLSSPLLGRRVQYRAPHYGDCLLQYGVRLATEPPADDDYHKYYIATLSSLPTDIVPSLVPYRRYELPAAAALLTADITGRPPPAPAPSPRRLQDLDAAVQEFTAHVMANKDYLMEQLVFL